MSAHKVLVVFYSRTGKTEKVARAMAAGLDADLDRLIDGRKREGKLGYLSAFFDGALERRTRLEGKRRDPSQYDLVIIGSPVWNGALSAPVRSYLHEYWSRLPEVAFFATCGQRGNRALRQMKELSERDPRAAMELDEDQLASGAYQEKVADFVSCALPMEPPHREIPVTPSDAIPPPEA